MNKGHSASCFIYGYVSSDQKKKKDITGYIRDTFIWK